MKYGIAFGMALCRLELYNFGIAWFGYGWDLLRFTGMVLWFVKGVIITLEFKISK